MDSRSSEKREHGGQGLEDVVVQQKSPAGVEMPLVPKETVSADRKKLTDVLDINAPNNCENKGLHSQSDGQQTHQLQQHTFPTTDPCSFRQTGLSKQTLQLQHAFATTDPHSFRQTGLSKPGTRTCGSTLETEHPQTLSVELKPDHEQQKQPIETAENKASVSTNTMKQDVTPSFRPLNSPNKPPQNETLKEAELGVGEKEADSTLNPKHPPNPTQLEKKLVQNKHPRQNSTQTKEKGNPRHVSTLRREESQDVTLGTEPSNVKELSAKPVPQMSQHATQDKQEGALTNLCALFKPGNKREEPQGIRQPKDEARAPPVLTKELPNKAPQKREAQQTSVQSKQEVILRHQQNVLPTVEVRGSSVQYYYQGLPGRSKTFQPDTRTRALLEKTSQIGDTLNYLRHRKNNRLCQTFVEGGENQQAPEEEEDDSDEDDNADADETPKAQFATLLKSWPQAASEGQTRTKRNRRKAAMRSVLTMNSGLKATRGRPTTVPDLEDTSLPGWRLLRLYRLWSNARARPVWASSDYLQRKQQEAEQHHSRQGRGRIRDLHSAVLRATSAAGVSRKPDPSSDHGVGVAAKLWMRSSTSMFPRSPEPAPSSFSTTMTTTGGKTNQLPSSDHRMDSLSISDAHSHVPYVARAGSKGGPRLLKASGRVVRCDWALAGREPLVRGRKVVLGRELKMSVGNMVLSTGLTPTVAKARRHHPDVFLRTDS